MFHCLMTDVLLTTTFGAHRDAFQKWASGEEDVVSVAMEDFPKRGMLVSARCPFVMTVIHCSYSVIHYLLGYGDS